jgi:hypothetical protein
VKPAETMTVCEAEMQGLPWTFKITRVSETLESMKGSKCKQKYTEHDLHGVFSQSTSLNLMMCTVMLAQELWFFL